MPLSNIIKRLLFPLFRLVPARRAGRIIRKLQWPFRSKEDIGIKFGNGVIYVHSIDRLLAVLLWKYSLLSDFESRTYNKIIKENMTVLEIGANIGYFTILFSKLVGEKGKVFAFEPDPDNFRLLEKNVSRNGLKNVTCVRKAVSHRTGTERLFISDAHHGAHRIFDSFDGRESMAVDSIAIDDFLPPDTAVDFIKMDIEGAEYFALTGMEKTIKNSGPLIMICEFFPDLLEKAGVRPSDFLEKLVEMDFELNCMDEDMNRIRPSGNDDLLNKCRTEDYVNLYLEKNHTRPAD